MKYTVNLTSQQVHELNQYCGDDKDFHSIQWQRSLAFEVNETLARGFEKSVYKYAQINVVAANIFIRSPFAEQYIIEEDISVIQFIANIGGLMGLFMGFSCVSGLEIVYHFLAWIGAKCRYTR